MHCGTFMWLKGGCGGKWVHELVSEPAPGSVCLHQGGSGVTSQRGEAPPKACHTSRVCRARWQSEHRPQCEFYNYGGCWSPHVHYAKLHNRSTLLTTLRQCTLFSLRCMIIDVRAGSKSIRWTNFFLMACVVASARVQSHVLITWAVGAAQCEHTETENERSICTIKARNNDIITTCRQMGKTRGGLARCFERRIVLSEY